MNTLLRCLLPVLLSAFPLFLAAQPKIQLVSHASGFTRPVDIAHCGDSRLFVVEQRGMIWMLDSLGNRLQDTFLNIVSRVRSSGNEQGLLGLAFPPDYAQSGLFYVYYTRQTDGDTRLSRFSRKPGNPNQADPASEEILLTQDQPFPNHNGGCLKFGADGYLYVSLGDGGSGDDPNGNGQNKNTLLGKLLRIDVHSTSPGLPYGIPGDNPFVGQANTRSEIWAYGLRNPWRYSFDRLTGDLWIGDVGQNAHEEIDFEPANSGGGRNYGWRCYEGNSAYLTTNCPGVSSFTMPAFDYPNPSIGCSVTGGFIYRGAEYSDLYGLYLFTDYCSGRWWTIRRRADGTFTSTQIADLTNGQYSTLGEDRDGELYVAALGEGRIYRVTELCSGFQISGAVTPATCHGAYDGIIDLGITGGAQPYQINWSGGQTDSLAVYLNPGTYAVQVQDGNGCIRRDTFDVPATVDVPTPGNVVESWTAPTDLPVLLCNGDHVLLSASEAPTGFGYQWYRNGNEITNADQQSFSVTQPGQYAVQYTGIPCNSPLSAPISVEQLTVTIPDPIVVSPGGNTFCPGDSLTLQAAVLPFPLQIQWYRNGTLIPGAEGPVYIAKEEGNYTVTYSSAVCEVYNSGAVHVVQEMLNGSLELNYAADTLRISLGPWAAYQWFLNGAPLAGATSPVLVPAESGFYECEVHSPGGCLYRTGLDVQVVSTRLPDFVSQLQIAPNPTDALFLVQLELKQTQAVTFQITDARQRLIFKINTSGQRIEQQIDLSGVPAGTYYLTVQTESGSLVRSIVKY